MQMNLMDVIDRVKAEARWREGEGVQSYIYQQKPPMRTDKQGREPVSIAWLETEHLLAVQLNGDTMAECFSSNAHVQDETLQRAKRNPHPSLINTQGAASFGFSSTLLSVRIPFVQ